ncbi:hypothetical protein E4U43_000199 [Claviceps pusilla]|uniref:Phytocyanin domain-containing protein n=1 Tax=Claviceps pusilla TaxID=123648 RepID=A0A9P7N9V1_9HYPO|nr:hypothetical protein E4U43_000199 [Claviceps pusilla]
MKFASAVCVAAVPLATARRVAHVDSPRAVPRSVAVLKDMQGAGVSANALTEVIIVWANPGNGAAATTVNKQADAVAAASGNDQGGMGGGGGGGGKGGKGGATETTKQGQTATVPSKGASHTVKVGGPGGLTYQPEQLNNIPVGDTIVFEFLAQNHSVTQSAFDAPCMPLAGGMDSGFMANLNNSISPPPQVAMQVMTTKPLWFYCRQKGHCGKGMVFSINPTADKTHAMFQGLAIKNNGGGAATAITVGQQSAAPVAPAPKQTPAPSPAGAPDAEPPKQPVVASQSKQDSQASTGGIAYGKGTLGADGSCSCVVSCSPGSFPAAQAQGVGAIGGMGGAIPIMASMS